MSDTPNYYSRPLTEDRYNFKKHYDDNIYVVYANNNFSIKRNNTKPHFTCFIKQKGEEFGDALPIESPTSTYIFRLYNKSGNIIINGVMTSANNDLGEYRYEFNKLDLDVAGSYNGEIIEVEDNTENVIGKFSMNVI